MRKKLYLLLILLATTGFASAQSSYYYYYQGQKKYLTLHKKSFNIFTNNNFQTSSTASVGVKDYVLVEDASAENTKFAQVELISEPNTTTGYNQKLNQLRQLPNIEHVGLYFENGDAEPVGISRHFYVKLKSIHDYNILQQIALQKNVEIVKQVPNMPQWYIMAVSIGNTNTSLELGNQFYESGLFEAVDPAFMLHFSNGDKVGIEEANNLVPADNGSNNDATCSYDPDFYRLWGLKNNTNSSIDINACQAWQISQGANINVAVLDQGIHTSHGDLNENFAGWSYNAQNGTSPSIYIPGNTHGTKVAGIVGAVRNNNLFIAGVAPRSKLIPISHDLKGGTNPYYTISTMSAQLADGITWAYQNGADIINNSWGASGVGAGSPLYSLILQEAITDALEQGRDGKGAIVVFAAGNNEYNPSGMFYPANFDHRIMTTGAITKTGTRWAESCYGAELDVVAPGHGVWTTTPNNAIAVGEGTSFAAPHVSGVAALILSVNQCLTGQQVRDIIEQTSQKIRTDLYIYATNTNRPNGPWNSEMGYGLIDAHAAVMMAKAMLLSNPCEQGIQQTSNLGTIDFLAPNPSTNNVMIKYNVIGSATGTLLIVQQTGNNTVYSYILDVSATETNISVNTFAPGYYTVALIVDGEVLDSKTLIKQ